MTRALVAEPLSHYLLSGCPLWPTERGHTDLDVYLLSGAVLRNHLDGLRRAWADCAPHLARRDRAGESFASRVLALDRFDPAAITCTTDHRHPGGHDAD